MMLKRITCSGANEYTDAEELVKVIGSYNKAELGIQVSGKKGGFGTARYWWIQTLYLLQYDQARPMDIALHVNSDWVERFCQGDIPEELKKFLDMRRKSGEPFIGRVQLNFKIGREKTPDLKKLLDAIAECQGGPQEEKHRFIFSYNEANAEFINEVYKTGLKFDLLYDNSHGEGIEPEDYPKPVYRNIEQGYAGGLSPENVEAKLWKISKEVPVGFVFNIDAEGRLKGEDGHLSLKKCEEYLKKASHWDAI